MIMSKHKYSIINIIVLLITLALFMFNFSETARRVAGYPGVYILALFVIVLFVNAIKAWRFYFVLYGENNITRQEFIKQYCKTIPVNVVLPFKIGELFRVCCFGYQINSFFRGLVFVLVDRFFDTIALIIVLIFVSLLTAQQFSTLLYLLLIFVAVVVAIYLMLPGLCSYWKDYLLLTKATKSSIKALKTIAGIEKTYTQISTILKGKGSITLFMSLLAWIIELFGMFSIEKILNTNVDTVFFKNYLMTALGMEKNAALESFVVATIALLLVVYIIMHFLSKSRKAKEND